MQTVPLSEELLPAAGRLCGASLTRAAAQLTQLGVRPPPVPAEEMAARMLARYLGDDAEAEGRTGWVVTDGTDVRAFAGATFSELAPDDGRYTYMPPRSVGVTASAHHVDSDGVAAECAALLLDTLRKAAAERGTPRLLVSYPPGSGAVAAAWRRLGLRLDVPMAMQRVTAWRPVGPPPPGTIVRVAGPDDVEALTDLALEEHHYHARHTATGTSPDQPRETSRRLAAEAVAAPADTSRQLVAERSTPGGSSVVVGSIAGTIHELADDQVQRYLLPPRYGYIGLTSVTATARGAGIGRTLVDALLGWFAERDVDTAFLHYVADNALSAPFWTGLGFARHIEIDGIWL